MEHNNHDGQAYEKIYYNENNDAEARKWICKFVVQQLNIVIQLLPYGAATWNKDRDRDRVIINDK